MKLLITGGTGRVGSARGMAELVSVRTTTIHAQQGLISVMQGGLDNWPTRAEQEATGN